MAKTNEVPGQRKKGQPTLSESTGKKVGRNKLLLFLALRVNHKGIKIRRAQHRFLSKAERAHRDMS